MRQYSYFRLILPCSMGGKSAAINNSKRWNSHLMKKKIYNCIGQNRCTCNTAQCGERL